MKNIIPILLILLLFGCKPENSYKPTTDDLTFALGMYMWTIEVPEDQPKGSLAIRLSYKGEDNIFYPFGQAEPGDTIKFFIWPTGNQGEINWCRKRIDSRGYGGGRGTRTHEIFKFGLGGHNLNKPLILGDSMVEGVDPYKGERFRLYLGLNEE